MNYVDKKIENDFINILCTSVTGNISNIKIEENEILPLFKLAKYHSVEYLFYLGLVKYISDIPEYIKKEVTVLSYKLATFDCELVSLKEAFNDNNIKFMPLKGSIIRTYYPKYEYRNMADFDILIEPGKLKEVGKVVKELGYEAEHLGGNHDVYFKKPYMNIELHRNLIDSLYVELSSYYENVWDRLILKEKCEYVLSKEDFYIFLIVHAAKHFSHGGTGLRVFFDLYYYLEKEALDFDYINLELEKLCLKKFNDCLINIVNTLFKDGKYTEDDKYLLDYIISCGSYGTTSNSDAISILKEEDTLENGKKKYLFKRIFPPYSTMKHRNPILAKLPFLLPWFWFTRGLKGLFHFKKYNEQAKNIQNVDESKVNEIVKIKEITGIRS